MERDKRNVYKNKMSGARRFWNRSDTTPLLAQQDQDDRPNHHLAANPPPNRSLSSVQMTSATPRSPPRSVFLGVDVGTGSARAGPSTSLHSLSLSISLYIYNSVFIVVLVLKY